MEKKEKLKNLIIQYQSLISDNSEALSEEMVRVWINEFLHIFGWDVLNPMQVTQEITISNEHEKKKLQEINSIHKRPDYTLKNGTVTKCFLDAKRTDINIFEDKETAFQIRSYGWSAGVPASFVTNFEQFVIFDTTFIPNKDQEANLGTIRLTIDDYLDHFDLLDKYLSRENIWNNCLDYFDLSKNIEGNQPLDEKFSLMLEEFRLRLGISLLNTSEIDEESLNYFSQVILNQILFIRVCESREIEPEGLLKRMLSHGFWDEFTKRCINDFYVHYDGVLFSPRPELTELKLDNNVFDGFIESLYYPSPYRFDVIPLSTIASIYEEFLGKRLIIKGKTIKAEIKSEYQKNNGVVPTPAFLANLVCKQTINIDKIKTVESLFSQSIFDPCCGSGIFLISAYDLLETKLIQLISKNRDQYKELYISNDDEIILTIKARTKLIENCLYGIDLDENAIEVCRLSLALKIIDIEYPHCLVEAGCFRKDLLKGIDRNVRLGNSLVWPTPEYNLIELKSVDIKKIYPSVFDAGGFDYILSNPPYVEPKHFNGQKSYHSFLSQNYSVYDGKADLAILFIYRSLQLLKTNGSLGFLVQRRWFKTQYGNKIREYINDNKYLKLLIDFKSTDLFKGRITYVSCLVLEKNINDKVVYLFDSQNPRWDRQIGP